MSSFLVPQEPVADILGALTQHPTYVSQRAIFAEREANAIPGSLFHVLLEALHRTTKPFGPSSFGEEFGLIGYLWTQRDRTITVSGPWSPRFSDADLVVTESEVMSPRISGAFFEPAISVSASLTDDRTRFQIELTVAREWPIIIIGGERIDAISLFYLAVFASREGMDSEMEPLLVGSALSGFAPGISSLAQYYLEHDRADAAFFWFTKFAEVTQKPDSLIIPAQILLSTDTKRDALLAENILVVLAREGAGTAFYLLGCLHLKDARVFRADAALAVRYFEHAAAEFGDNEAKKALGVLFCRGRGVECNIPKGIQLLREAGEPEEKLRRLMPPQTEIPPSGPALVDWVIVGGVVAAVCAGVFLAFRFLRR